MTIDSSDEDLNSWIDQLKFATLMICQRMLKIGSTSYARAESTQQKQLELGRWPLLQRLIVDTEIGSLIN